MSAIGTRIVVLGLVATVVAACGAPPSPGGGAAATPTPVATVAATPPSSASPTARPSPVVSSKGAITVTEPASGEQITSPLTISGEASVFEATLVYRVVTTVGKVLAEGTTTASAGAPQRGTFKVEVKFETPYYGEPGTVEVFERSPKDGTISDIAKVSVAIVGTY